MSDDDPIPGRRHGDDAPTPLNPPDVRAAEDSPAVRTLGSLQELSAALEMAAGPMP